MFLIFIICLPIICTQIFYNATEFIEKIRSETPADEAILKEAIENTKEFLKHYIYYNIAQDPPPPDFDKSYFPKINFSNLFKGINTKDTNYFDFSREFISEVYKLNDLHTAPYFQRIHLENYVYVCPLELSTLYDSKIILRKCMDIFQSSQKSIINSKIMKKFLTLLKIM